MGQRVLLPLQHGPVLPTSAHISILGHTTEEELRRRLAESEAEGFSNDRFGASLS